jgi:NAD/NADP transhydrogenase beta subunit
MQSMLRRFIGPVIAVVGLLLACVATVVFSSDETGLGGMVVILMVMVSGAGVGLSVSWSGDQRHRP